VLGTSEHNLGRPLILPFVPRCRLLSSSVAQQPNRPSPASLPADFVICAWIGRRSHLPGDFAVQIRVRSDEVRALVKSNRLTEQLLRLSLISEMSLDATNTNKRTAPEVRNKTARETSWITIADRRHRESRLRESRL
jgi:hypothetical protein